MTIKKKKKNRTHFSFLSPWMDLARVHSGVHSFTSQGLMTTHHQKKATLTVQDMIEESEVEVEKGCEVE